MTVCCLSSGESNGRGSPMGPSWKRFAVSCCRAAVVALCLGFLLAALHGEQLKTSFDPTGAAHLVGHRTAIRKLLGAVAAGATERMGEGCTRDDVVMYQGETAPLPNGIPTYTVQVLNTCLSGCAVSDIHVSCGWFSSARLVNPKVFRRIGFDDCLVNDGAPLGSGQSLSFQYANTYRYPLYIASVSCD